MEEPASQEPSKKVVGIDDFDARSFNIINSPRSLEAMRLLGILQLDLRLQTYEDLKGMFKESIPEEKKALERIVNSNLENHKRMIEKIKLKRQELIQKEIELEGRKRRKELSSADRIISSAKRSTAPPERSSSAHSSNPGELNTSKGNTAAYGSMSMNNIKTRTRQLEILAELSGAKGDYLRLRQKKDLETMMGFEINTQKIKKKMEHNMKERIEALKKEQQEKEQKHQDLINKMTREKQLKDLEKKLERERKLLNVERTTKARTYEQEVMAKRIQADEQKAAKIKEGRENANKARELMRKQLQKDLLLFREGALGEEFIKSKYAGLHDDDVFDSILDNAKKENAPKGVSRLVTDQEALKYYAKSLEKPIKEDAGKPEADPNRRDSQLELPQRTHEKSAEKFQSSSRMVQAKTSKQGVRAEMKSSVGLRAKETAESKVKILAEIKRRQVNQFNEESRDPEAVGCRAKARDRTTVSAQTGTERSQAN